MPLMFQYLKYRDTVDVRHIVRHLVCGMRPDIDLILEER